MASKSNFAHAQAWAPSCASRQLLIQIILKIPEEWGTQIESEASQNVTVLPANSMLIENKIRSPQGLLRWCEDLHLSDSQIKTVFMFAHSCSSIIFDHVFQYKIGHITWGRDGTVMDPCFACMYLVPLS